MSKRLIAIVLACASTFTPHGALFAQPGKNPEEKAAPLRMWDHRGSVLAMEFTRDGKHLVTGGSSFHDSAVIWDFATGKRVQAIKNAGVVYSLSLSPDGKRIATAGYTGILEQKKLVARVAVWDAATGKELLAIKVKRPGDLPCIAFSPDGKLLATSTIVRHKGGEVGAIQLWDAASGKMHGEPLRGLSQPFSQVKFSPDGKTLAAAAWGEETFAVLWDVETQRQRFLLKSKKTWTLIRSLAFSPDGSQLGWVSGNEVNGSAEHLLWNVVDGKRSASLRADKMLSWLAFDSDGQKLYTVDLDGGSFQAWERQSLKPLAGFTPATNDIGMVQSAALSPDGNHVVIGTGNPQVYAPPLPEYGAIRIFDRQTGRERLAPEAEARRAKEEALEAARLAAAAQAARQREEQERQALEKLPAETRAKIEHAAAAVSHTRYALHLQQAHQAIQRGHFVAAKKLLELYLPKNGANDLRSFEWHFLWRQCQFTTARLEQPDTINASWQGAGPRLSPDGKTLAVATTEHEVHLWDLTRDASPRTLAQQGAIRHMDFSRDGRYLLTCGGSDQKTISTYPPTPVKDDPSARLAIVWEVQTGKPICKLEGSEKAIECLAFAADASMAALGDVRGGVRVFELPSGKLKASTHLRDDFPRVLAFAPDGLQLAVGTNAGKLCLWSLNKPEPATLDKGAKMPVSHLHFDTSGKTLYAIFGGWSNNYLARRWVRQDADRWDLTRDWKLVHRLAISPDGTRLALSSWHGVALWDVVEDREIGRIVPRVSGDGLDSQLAFSPDGNELLVHAHRIREQPDFALFDARDGRKLGVLDDSTHFDPALIHLDQGGRMTAVALGPGRDRRVQVLLRTTLSPPVRGKSFDESAPFRQMHGTAFSPDAAKVAATNGARLFYWDLKSDLFTKSDQSSNQPITLVRYSADGGLVLSSDHSGIKLWEAGSSKPQTHLRTHYGSVSADGKRIFTTKGSHTLSVHNARDGRVIATLSPNGVQPPAEDLDDHIAGTAVSSPSGKWIVALGPYLFDAAAKKEVKRWEGDILPVHFAFTSDDRTLVTTDTHGTLTVWNLPKLKERYVLPKIGSTQALSADNRTALVTQVGSPWSLVDLESGSVNGTLQGHSAMVTQAVFSPDGKSLATADYQGRVYFWCPHTGNLRLSFRAHGNGVSGLAFSSDSSLLATSCDRDVRVWAAR